MFRPAFPLAAAAIALAPAAAQVVPAPLATPEAAPAPQPTQASADAPSPRPSPVPSATPAFAAIAERSLAANPARPVTARPRARPTPAARPSPTPRPTAAPTLDEPPAGVADAPAARATPGPIDTVVLPSRRSDARWPWLLAGAATLVALGWAALRRRRPYARAEPVGAAAATAPEPARPAAHLTVELRPVRAGLNLISATVAYEVTIANDGGAMAEDIRPAVRLSSAHADQDAELAAFFAEPAPRPETIPFALQPGEERRFRAVAALPHGAIRPLHAGGRAMFVPLMALSARYRDGARDRQVGRAFAIGVERVDSAKLAPFWLDAPARTYDSVAARPHGAPIAM